MTDEAVFAFGLDGKGGGTPLRGEAISQHIKDDQLAWVHFDLNNEQAQKWIRKELSYLDPFVAEALLAEETRPRMTQLDDGTILILRGVNFNDDQKQEDMISIRMWIDANRIISVQRQPLRATQAIVNKIEKGKGPKDAGGFITLMVSQLFSRFEVVLSDLDEETDNCEERILENADPSQRQRIINLRKKSISYRRHMSPQKDAVFQLKSAELSWISDVQRRQLNEYYNYVLRYVEDLDTIRERAQIVKDELASQLSDRLNKNTYVLSVIAAIFLPLGFLTGLLGINIGGIPGTESSMAFTVFCIMLTIVVAVQIWVFKKLKWF